MTTAARSEIGAGTEQAQEKMNKTHTITLSLEYEGLRKMEQGRYTVPTKIKRRVCVDGREVYMDRVTFDLWDNDDSILRQFELWAIKAEQSVPQFKNRDKSVGQFKKFLRSVAQTWRKVLHTQRY